LGSILLGASLRALGRYDFPKVRLLLNLLSEMTVEQIFENFDGRLRFGGAVMLDYDGSLTNVYIYVVKFVYRYVYIYIYVYICIFVYIYMHIYV